MSLARLLGASGDPLTRTKINFADPECREHEFALSAAATFCISLRPSNGPGTYLAPHVNTGQNHRCLAFARTLRPQFALG